jgi:hypothetical protein
VDVGIAADALLPSVVAVIGVEIAYFRLSFPILCADAMIRGSTKGRPESVVFLGVKAFPSVSAFSPSVDVGTFLLLAPPDFLVEGAGFTFDLVAARVPPFFVPALGFPFFPFPFTAAFFGGGANGFPSNGSAS